MAKKHLNLNPEIFGLNDQFNLHTQEIFLRELISNEAMQLTKLLQFFTDNSIVFNKDIFT